VKRAIYEALHYEVGSKAIQTKVDFSFTKLAFNLIRVMNRTIVYREHFNIK